MGKYVSKHKKFCQPLQIEAETSEETFAIENKKQCLSKNVACMKIPILKLHGIVLFPGQTIPLHLFDARDVSLLRRLDNSDGDRTIGILTTKFRDASTGEVTSNVGCTAELISIVDNESTDSVEVKAIGRKRFKVVAVHRQLDGNILADVCVLSERLLSSPLEGVMSTAQRKLRVSESVDVGSLSGAPTRHGIKRKADCLSAAYLTAWPPWVYRQYDTKYLVDEISKKLVSSNQTSSKSAAGRVPSVDRVGRVPSVDRAGRVPAIDPAGRVPAIDPVGRMPSVDPVELSLWLAANLPLDDQLKLQLLGMDCAVQRLRCQLAFLSSCTMMCCKDCQLMIASTQDVFTVDGAGDGPLAMHVNPGGVVHELITVSTITGIRLVGPAVLENSWFPGYAWTVMDCANCMAHVGWRFTRAVRSSRAALRAAPDTFYGICRSSILPAAKTVKRNVSEYVDSE